MSSWVRIYPSLIDDFDIHRMSPEEFVAKFEACVRSGEKNEFSRHIKPGLDRPVQSEWARIRTTVFERDDFTCRYCGERGGRLECDHVVPVSRGGSHDFDNLATACFGCNRSKRDKMLAEWTVTR